MTDPFTRRLGGFIDLSEDEAGAVRALLAGRTRDIPVGGDIAAQGESFVGVSIVLSGWAIRAKVLTDGRRQIIAFLLPGDVCGFGNGLFHSMDHMVGALSPVTLADIDLAALDRTITAFPRLGLAFRWDRAVAASVQREWTVNLGQRTAFERFGHLFCELLLRLRLVGLTDGDRFDLPTTQADLADAMGVSTVHANRVLQELRQAGLIRTQGGALEVLDFRRLARVSLFEPAYLHLDGWRPEAGGEPGRSPALSAVIL